MNEVDDLHAEFGLPHVTSAAGTQDVCLDRLRVVTAARHGSPLPARTAVGRGASRACRRLVGRLPVGSGVVRNGDPFRRLSRVRAHFSGCSAGVGGLGGPLTEVWWGKHQGGYLRDVRGQFRHGSGWWYGVVRVRDQVGWRGPRMVTGVQSRVVEAYEYRPRRLFAVS